MNILDLIQASAGQTPGFGDEAGGIPADIEVVAEPKRKIAVDERDEPGPRKTDELIKRSGLFGVKGTLRDVLGTLGDAFLVGSGNKQIYGPQREKEKLQSAMYGFTNDPQAAAERVALVDPALGRELNQDYQTQQRYAQQSALQQQQLLAQKAAVAAKGATLVGSYARTLNSPEKYKLGRAGLQKVIDQYGLDVTLPEEYDENSLSDLFTRGQTPDQLVDNDRADRGLESQNSARAASTSVARQRAAEQARHNRAMEARPTSSSQPRPKSATNVDAEVLQKIRDGSATPAEKAYYNDRLKRGGGKTSAKRTPPPLPPGFQLKTK